MAVATQVDLQPGRVYRTADLRRWSKNPTRLAGRLEREGRLRRLGHGMFHAPRSSRFGAVPPSDEDLLDRLFDGAPWVMSGPDAWNALGLGSTAVYAYPLVYNTKRTGTVELGGRRFTLRRRAFPHDPPAEYFVVDLLRHADEAGVALATFERHLALAVANGRFDGARLVEMATRFGTHREQQVVSRAVAR